VLLSLPQPEDPSPYRRAFGRAKLVFEAEHFGLIYTCSALTRPILTADPASHAEIRKFVAERWNFLQPDILDRVMRVLVPSVLGGKPSLKATTELLVMHPRTLNRALQTRGLFQRGGERGALSDGEPAPTRHARERRQPRANPRLFRGQRLYAVFHQYGGAAAFRVEAGRVGKKEPLGVHVDPPDHAAFPASN
jgi:hypothetical protein